MRAAVGLALVAVVAAAVAGCGGGQSRLSKTQYRATLRTADRTIATVTASTITDAQESGWVVGSPRARRAARELNAAFDRVERTLSGLQPPRDVTQDNRELVAGLRATAHDYTVELLGGDARDYAAFFSGHVNRRYDRAQKDLQAKGYEPKPRGYEFEIAADGTPKPAKPFPFAVVSRAGRQVAAGLNASFCPPQPVSHSCGPTAVLESPTGPRPNGLSVVRPGEPIHIRLAHPNEVLISLFVDPLCTSSPRDTRDFSVPFSSSPTWAAKLPPGRYVATFLFDRPTKKGETNETGFVGLLVSNTQPERIVQTPACG